jgi:hypothetical protein
MTGGILGILLGTSFLIAAYLYGRRYSRGLSKCTRSDVAAAPADRASRPGLRSIRFAALLSKSRPSFPR